MQTFLPYPDFSKSARVLDNKRLGKQRVECLQILGALSVGHRFICPKCKQGKDNSTCADCQRKCKRTPWYNHPAAQMWKGYEYKLTCYGIIICREWINRGFKDNCVDKICKHQANLYEQYKNKYGVNSIGVVDETHKPYPPWLGQEDFHAAHRAALLVKDYAHYSKFGWKETPALNYVWPVSKQ